MTESEFYKIYDSAIERISSIVKRKHAEYGEDSDYFYNFNRGSEILGTHPAGVLAAYMTKHTVSVYDIINEFSRGESVKISQLEEKITDLIVYLLLFEGMVKEKFQNEQ